MDFCQKSCYRKSIIKRVTTEEVIAEGTVVAGVIVEEVIVEGIERIGAARCGHQKRRNCGEQSNRQRLRIGLCARRQKGRFGLLLEPQRGELSASFAWPNGGGQKRNSRTAFAAILFDRRLQCLRSHRRDSSYTFRCGIVDCSRTNILQCQTLSKDLLSKIVSGCTCLGICVSAGCNFCQGRQAHRHVP